MSMKEAVAATPEWQLERHYVQEYNRFMLLKTFVDDSKLHVEPTNSNPIDLQPNSCLLQFVDVHEQNGKKVELYEDFQGIPMTSFLERAIPLDDFYKIAKQLIHACIFLHQQRYIFQQLNPAHILIHLKTLHIKLVPSMAMSKWGTVANLEDDLNSLLYIAPEQTGRIPLEIDERVDLYALGATFYGLLVGELFTSTSHDDLLFQIVTKMPTTEKIVDRTGNEQLAQIITKLLHKNPADRYQSALALKHDLQLLEENRLHGIAQSDQLFYPKPTTDICGRELELQQLTQVFSELMGGKKRLLLLNGSSGSGKTSFLQQLKPKVTATHGYYIDYKFEERHQHDIDAMIQPLRQLLKQLFFKGNGAVEMFKQEMVRLNVLITENLLTLLPELRVVIDKSMYIAKDDIDFTMKQHMYLFSAVKKIVQAIAVQRCPIVIVFDDCQWASSNAIDNALRIFEQHEDGYFAIVFTARNDQPTVIDEIVTKPEFAFEVTKIELSNLQEQDVVGWLEKSIVLGDDVRHYVANQLYQYTSGNPLFMKEVFNALVKNGAFYFNDEKNMWDLHEHVFLQIIEQHDLIDFIIERISFLSFEAQQLLQHAACIGNAFTLSVLRQMMDINDEELIECVEELVANGFIVIQARRQQGVANESFQFVHDRIQQTAYELMSLEERQRKHYTIAQLLQQAGLLELHLLVEQFQLSGQYVTQQDNVQLAIWNYELGLQSKNAGMYEQALRYFLTSESLLPENHWQTLREQSLNIFTYIGECSFLAGQYEQSEHYIQQSLQHTESSLEKLKIYRIMTFLYIESEESDDVLKVGYLAFQECGIKLPDKPQKHHVLMEYVKLKAALQNKSNATLLHLPTIEKQEIDVLIQIIVNLITSSFRIDSNLSGVLLLRAMRLMSKYGIIAESAIVFVNYALVLAVGFQDFKQSSRFGRLALELADQQNNPYIKMRVYFAYGTFIHYWEHDYEGSLHYIRSAQHYARQCGMPSIINAASCFIVATEWMRGVSLKELHESISFEQSQSDAAIVLAKDYLTEFRQWVEVLRNETITPEWHYDFQLQQENAVVVMHHILRLQMSYLLYDEKEAKLNLERLALPMRESFNLITAPLYFLYRALWQLEWLQHDVPKKVRVQYKLDIKQSLAKFKNWAKASPQNFEHLYTLLRAEYARMKKQDSEASIYFDRALQLARMHHFVHDHALIYERTGKYYDSQRDREKSKDYISRGVETIQKWGATTIVKQWDRRYETHFSSHAPHTRSMSLDLKTVLETTQSLAKEIRMEDLLQKLLFSLLKHCNATSGYFIRKLEDGLCYTAKVEAEQMAFHYNPQGMPLHEYIQMMAEFVLQCDEPVLIKNVQKNALFSNSETTAKSMLCLPVHHHGDVLAVLYLENNLLYNAFNMEQLELIQMVTTQIAVSIENAGIYEDLERRVAERAKLYEEMNHHLMAVNDKLERNEVERKKLFQSISDELHSPIATSLQYIESVLDESSLSPEQQGQYLQRSRDQLLALKGLMNDLFDLARLESEHTEIIKDTTLCDE